MTIITPASPPTYEPTVLFPLRLLDLPYSTLLAYLPHNTKCSASSAPAFPLLVAQHPHALPRSTNSRPRTASIEEPDPVMSSIADSLVPLGTAAHLPPGGLIAVVWCCVIVAGAFGVYWFFLEHLILNPVGGSDCCFFLSAPGCPYSLLQISLGVWNDKLQEIDTDSEFTSVVARTLIRVVKAEPLALDDYWIYLAYLILCVNAVLQSVQVRSLYRLERVRAGLEVAGEVFLEIGDAYLRYKFATIGLFWSVLWSVSACFLSNRSSVEHFPLEFARGFA